MCQLKKVAVATLSASITSASNSSNPGGPYDRSKIKRRRSRKILFLLFQFKAKHRKHHHHHLNFNHNHQHPNHKLQEPNSTPEGHTPSDQKKTGFEHLDTFHRAVKPILYVSQFFGILPVANIRSADPKGLVFRMESWPMLFTALFFVFGGLKILHFTMALFKSGLHAKNLVGIVFYYINMSVCIRFLVLAKSWPELIQHWTRVELIFLVSKVYKPVSQWTLRFKLQSFVCIFTVIALVEHSMYYASLFYNYRMRTIHCEKNITEPPSFYDYLVKQHLKDVFTYFQYHWFIAFYAVFLHASFTIIWNFLDVFIMLVGLSLAVRFKQLAKRMHNNEKRIVTDDVWYELRQHHIQLMELVAKIDAHVSILVLISCLNNMYFITNQLLSIFTKLRWPINYAYFWFSLMFLIGRTASVFLCGGQINDASLLPLHSLYRVPPGCWSEEVQRFYAQIRDESIALTGKRFFNVTRKSLFGFAATIVTYEFMLLQFDKKSWKAGLPPICA